MATVTPPRETVDDGAAAPVATSGEPPTKIDASAGAESTIGRRQRRGGARLAGASTLAVIERKLGLTTVGVAFVVVTITLVIGGRKADSRGLILAGYGLAIVLGISWLLGRRNLSIDADRSKMATRVRARQAIDVELSLTARRRISGVIVEEQLAPQLGVPVRIAVPLLPAGQSRSHVYAFSPNLRGIYKVGPLVAEWTDPFGLTRRRQQIAPEVEVIVHPNAERVVDRITSREWEDPPVRPPISKPWPTGFEFYGMREYADGDDPRRIVWRAVAQYGKYLVREAEQGITDRVKIYLDSDAEYHSPGEDSETFETGVAAAAALASKHLKDGFSVGLNINSGQVGDRYRGQASVIPLLDQMAGLKREAVSFTSALDRLFSDPHRSAHNIIITPHLSQAGAARLRLILQRGASLILVLLVWDDTDPLTIHRAGGLGCNVVEVSAGMPLAAVFQHVIGTRRT